MLSKLTFYFGSLISSTVVPFNSSRIMLIKVFDFSMQNGTTQATNFTEKTFWGRKELLVIQMAIHTVIFLIVMDAENKLINKRMKCSLWGLLSQKAN